MVGAKPRPKKRKGSPLEKLTVQDIQTLRLDEVTRAEFSGLVSEFTLSLDQFHPFADEDVSAMDDERYALYQASHDQLIASSRTVVHFMAPRILRLRPGDARRKWQSFLTKFQKDQHLI